MVTIKIEIAFGEEKHNLTALLSDDLSEIIRDKRNDATIIDDDFGEQKIWCIVFGDMDADHHQVIFKRNDAFEKTTDVLCAYIGHKGALYEIDESSIKYGILKKQIKEL